MWVFGYGSLVWKVDFPYEIKLVGYIKGYLRRFYQHSTDHRGIPEKMWLFGYGSLVWKVDFPYEIKLVGYIKGYLRRFYQHSTDHRGIPEKPGRVVTLIPSEDPDSTVWGVAYKIRPEDIDKVTKYLDFREKNGYSQKTVTFHPKDVTSDSFTLTLYIATEDNESFAGPESIQQIAQQVIHSVGPSGPNKEYVYKLATAMRQLAPDIHDDHLYTLEQEVRKLDPDPKQYSCDT